MNGDKTPLLKLEILFHQRISSECLRFHTYTVRHSVVSIIGIHLPRPRSNPRSFLSTYFVYNSKVIPRMLTLQAGPCAQRIPGRLGTHNIATISCLRRSSLVKYCSVYGFFHARKQFLFPITPVSLRTVRTSCKVLSESAS